MKKDRTLQYLYQHCYRYTDGFCVSPHARDDQSFFIVAGRTGRIGRYCALPSGTHRVPVHYPVTETAQSEKERRTFCPSLHPYSTVPMVPTSRRNKTAAKSKPTTNQSSTHPPIPFITSFRRKASNSFMSCIFPLEK